jgi:hypothetical protein
MTSTADMAFEPLWPEGGFREQHVRHLAELVDGELPLQTFLEQLLPALCNLLEAPAAVVWMKTQGAVFGVRYRMDSLLSTVSLQKRHERLVQFAWQHQQPLLAEPTHRPEASGLAIDPLVSQHPATQTSPNNLVSNNLESMSGGQVSNPTGQPLLFAPILHMGLPIALLEIVLPLKSSPLTAQQKQIYLRSMHLIAQRVYGGLKSRMAMPAAQLSRAQGELGQLVIDLQGMQQQILKTIESRLAQFHAWSFRSLAENQEFAKVVHQLLDSHGLRVQCPECGHPAILRCLRAGNSKNGVFVFDHYLDSGRTFHGGPTTVPLLKVIAKPARRTQANLGSNQD